MVDAEERIGIRLRPRIVNPPARKLTGLFRTAKSPLPILHGHSLRVMTASPFRAGIKALVLPIAMYGGRTLVWSYLLQFGEGWSQLGCQTIRTEPHSWGGCRVGGLSGRTGRLGGLVET